MSMSKGYKFASAIVLRSHVILPVDEFTNVAILTLPRSRSLPHFPNLQSSQAD
jgi:hypothetical protein